MDLYYPLDPDLISEWPGPRGNDTHYGTDFRVNTGTPIAAPFDGVVVFVGGDGARGELYPGSGIFANGEGLTVEIRRDDGLISRMGHLSRVNVRVGQRVTAGLPNIVQAGQSGFSTGPHLHWELRWDRAWVGGLWADPRDLGAQALPSTTPPPPTYQEDHMNYISITGKAGERRGGLYAVLRGEQAIYLGGPAPEGIPTVSDEASIATLQKHIRDLR